MAMLDDAMFALIARFVVNDLDHLSVSEEKFLQHQLVEIKGLLRDVPAEEHQQIVMAWIRKHAEQYRQDWQKKAYTQLLSARRCSDCPLVGSDTNKFCIIHHKWKSLLEDYVAGKMPSDDYVEEALRLLGKYKSQLKIARIMAKNKPSG